MEYETIAGLFRNIDDAQQAVQSLEAAGFDRKTINILAREDVIAIKEDQEPTAKDVASSTAVGAVTGGVGGGLLGLLVGLGALTIPGIGPAIAAGSLATALGMAAGGASVGTAVGGIIGAMTGLSIPEEEAHMYAEGIKRGRIFVAVQAPETFAAQARDILIESGAEDTDALRENWRQDGWDGFVAEE